jgi:hypothetical protein
MKGDMSSSKEWHPKKGFGDSLTNGPRGKKVTPGIHHEFFV